MFSIFGGGSFAVDSLVLLLPLSMGFCVYTSLCPSSFALILMGNRELVALIVLIVLLLSFECKCSVALSHGSLG